MKQLLLTFAMALMGLGAMAQVDNRLVFVDKAGNEIPNGTVVNVTEVEIDDFFGETLMHSGLYVKNNTDGEAYASMIVDIKRLDNGALQHCFPGTCQFYTATGEVVRTEVETMAAGRKANIMSEWAPTGEGMCTVVYTIRPMDKGFGANYIEAEDLGPSVTVNFCNGVFPDRINAVNAKASEAKAVNLQGQAVGNNYRGIVIKDGKKCVR